MTSRHDKPVILLKGNTVSYFGQLKSKHKKTCTKNMHALKCMFDLLLFVRCSVTVEIKGITKLVYSVEMFALQQCTD